MERFSKPSWNHDFMEPSQPRLQPSFVIQPHYAGPRRKRYVKFGEKSCEQHGSFLRHCKGPQVMQCRSCCAASQLSKVWDSGKGQSVEGLHTSSWKPGLNENHCPHFLTLVQSWFWLLRCQNSKNAQHSQTSKWLSHARAALATTCSLYRLGNRAQRRTLSS